jgi:hypothetical protein
VGLQALKTKEAIRRAEGCLIAPPQSRAPKAISGAGAGLPKRVDLLSRILMKPDKVPIPDVQTLKFRRDELFRDFEDHPAKLALAREIKDIDDQIAELNVGKKKGRAEFPT